MKKLIALGLLALIFTWSAANAQVDASQSSKLTADQQKALDEAVAMDPKLSSEEVENLKLAVKGAPTKPEPVSDPRMTSQPEVVHAAWKAGPAGERDDVVQQPPALSVPSGAANTQPIPEKPENAPERNNAGPSSDQPVPPANTGARTVLKRNGPKDQPPVEPEKK